MGLLTGLRLRFKPPRIEDPDFGPLLFMYIPNAPANSYWEGEWLFPPTGTAVAIALSGTETGPGASARAFYLSLPAKFEQTVASVRAPLDGVFRHWLDRPLDADLWRDVTLAGFGVEDPDAESVSWDVAFETKGDKWLGITVPFVGDQPQEPVVDT